MANGEEEMVNDMMEGQDDSSDEDNVGGDMWQGEVVVKDPESLQNPSHYDLECNLTILIGTQTIKTMAKAELMIAMGIDSHKSLTEMLKGETVRPFWREYYFDYLYPTQQKAATAGKIRVKGPDMGSVMASLVADEAEGTLKYSTPMPDKSTWEPVDHHARFIYWVRMLMLSHVDGALFSKSRSDTEVDRIVWSLLSLLVHEHAQSPVIRPTGGYNLIGDFRPDAQARHSKGDNMQVDSPEVDTPAGRAQPVPDSPDMEMADATVGGSLGEACPNLQETLPQTLNPAPGKRKRTSGRDNRKRQHLMQEDSPEHITDAETPRQPAVVLPWLNEVMTPRERLRLTKKSATMNLAEPYWQMVFLRDALQRATPAVSDNGDETTESAPDDRDQPMASASDDRPPPVHNIFDADKWQLSMDSTHWAEMEENSESVCLEPTPEDLISYNERQTWINNKAFQRENHDDACSELQIPNPDIPRMPGLRLGSGENPYRALLDSVSHPHPKPKPLKPTLVVVPPSLVCQWQDKIKRLSKKLVPVIYYGDSREVRAPRPDWKISGKLRKSHPIFNGSVESSCAVVITSYPSLAVRHGPSAQKEWRLANRNVTETMANSTAMLLDSDWPGALTGLFGRVILGEAHLIRKPSAFSSAAVAWLKADFYLLLSATPTFNRIGDFRGFQQLLFTPDADKRWEGFDPATDPFLGNPPPDIASLQLTPFAMTRYVWDFTENTKIQGARIGRLWEHCFLRRTLSSCIPFDSSKQIGSDIPMSRYQVIKARFTPSEKEVYDKLTPPLYRRLVRRLADGRLAWNMAKYRQLVLLTTWLDFRWVHESVKAANMPLAVRKAKDGTLLFVWMEKVMKDQGLNFDLDRTSLESKSELLCRILRSSPRLRELIPLIIDMVLHNREKAIIWCLVPVQQVLVAAVLMMAGIDARIFHASLSMTERATLVQEFNNARNSCMVLVGAFAVSCVGLNLQHLCRNVVLLDRPCTESIVEQAIGRCWRLGQQRVVKIYEIQVPDSFNDRQVANASDKAIAGLVTQLNRGLFNVGTEEDALVLGNWASDEGGNLYMVDDPEALPDSHRLLGTSEVLEMVYKAFKG
ncbi:hypothetical protein FQN50_003629 [Emmonsiellopsis sp. PD_5]|nr:hypothetical protein FQN50_003629 [Emmonsiellopsis sp. PD_5]